MVIYLCVTLQEVNYAYFVNLTQVRVIWEEGTSIRELAL